MSVPSHFLQIQDLWADYGGHCGGGRGCLNTTPLSRAFFAAFCCSGKIDVRCAGCSMFIGNARESGRSHSRRAASVKDGTFANGG